MTDNETDRALHSLVGLVVVAGSVCLIVAGLRLGMPSSLLYPIMVTGLVAIAGSCLVRVHVRAQHVFYASDAAILVAVALLPWPWVAICTAVGVAASMAVRRLQLKKAAFNTAKDVLGAAAASGAVASLGLAPLTTTNQAPGSSWSAYLVALCAAAVVYTAVDKLLTPPVIALASRTSWRRVLSRNVNVDVVVRAANLAVACATVALFMVDPVLLAATPLGVVFVYLVYRQRIHLREERRAWQQLAASTDAVGSAGLDEVLHTAIRGAVDLFPDLEVEVELGESARRVVRGDQGGISYDGALGQAPERSGPIIEVPLGADPGADGPLGVLRLRFRVEAKLSDHERCMLTTFAAGLSTAIRNAAAYAEVARLAEEHAFAALHDTLTGLPNRRQLHERMSDALESARDGTVALMLLDLDHFKDVNDTLGHTAGDRVLVEVAERLTAGAGDALVARLGGDEFAVLFTGLAAPTAASRRAQRVLDELRVPIELDGVLVDPQTSAGLAVAGDTTDPVELLRRADVAMYQSKDSGRQVAIYARTRDSADRHRLALAGELPRAVEGQEFTVEFQPIVDLASGMVIAAEALTRWRHPDLGHLPPAAFLGLIERSGLLAPFTEAVLHRALAAAAVWRDAGFDLPVSVNLSPRSLGDPALAKAVLHALDSNGVHPSRLTLEITETAAINQVDIVGRSVDTLQEEGVRIALDDFGTGQSSLAAVLYLPVNQLKIDRSFVAALETCRRAEALVCGTIEVSRRLDMTVVAEGIEDAQQRRALWELGCTAGQGSLFGWPPQPRDELIATLRRGHNGVAGAVADQLNPDATVVRLPRQKGRTDTPHAGQQPG